MKNLLWIPVLICSFSAIQSQNFEGQPDALYQEILKTRNPNIVLDLLDGFAVSEVAEDSLRGYFLYYKGTAYGQLGQMDSALYYVGQAEKQIPEGQYPIIQIQILRAYGNIYWAKSFFNLSLENYQKALRIAESINDAEFQISLLGNIAGIYAKLDNLPLALEYAEKSEVVSQRSGVIRPRSHLKIGLYSIDLGRHQKGIQSLKETIRRIQLDNRDSIALAVAHNNMAKGYLAIDDLRQARKSLEVAKDIITRVGYNEPAVYTYFAELNLKEKQILAAEEQIRQAIVMAKKGGDLSDLLLAKQIEKSIAAARSDDARVISTMDQIMALNDSIKSQQTLNRVYELEAQFDLAQKEAEIERLSLENELQTANLEKSRTAQLATAIGSVLIILVFVIYFTQRNKKLKAEREAQELQVEALKKRFLELHASPAELAVKLEFSELNEKLNTPLTEREFDSLKLSLAGKSNTEISEQLFISVSTVKFHLRNTYAKMGVGNRKEAFQYMLKTS